MYFFKSKLHFCWVPSCFGQFYIDNHVFLRGCVRLSAGGPTARGTDARGGHKVSCWGPVHRGVAWRGAPERRGTREDGRGGHQGGRCHAPPAIKDVGRPKGRGGRGRGIKNIRRAWLRNSPGGAGVFFGRGRLGYLIHNYGVGSWTRLRFVWPVRPSVLSTGA